MSLAERLLKASTITLTAPIEKSKVLVGLDNVATKVPIINCALSGQLDRGIEGGLGRIAGESKSFKTLLGLLMVSAYMEQHKDAVCLFFDSEFGAGFHYFNSLNIDMERVIHVPVTNIEELKFEAVAQLQEITRSDKVIMFVDSVGNLASKKEVEDAKDEKSVADMTRAKALASFFRIVTPMLTIKDVPMITIDHVYLEQGMYPKTIVSGGQKATLSADWILIVTKAQEKEKVDGKDTHVGYIFTLNVEKSRHVRERSKFPFLVTFEGGIQKWSGLLDIAVELGYVQKPKNGFYTRPCVENDKNHRAKGTNNSAFWTPIFTKTDFPDAIKKRYQIAQTDLIKSDIVQENDEGEDDDEV